MTTTTATPAKSKTATRTQKEKDGAEGDDFEDDFVKVIDGPARRYLHAKSNPADGKETKQTVAYRVFSDLWSRVIVPALQHGRGENAELRAEMDVVFQRLEEIDPPDFEEYLAKVAGFMVGVDVLVKFLLQKGKLFDDAKSEINDPEVKSKFEAFSAIYAEVFKDTNEFLAEYGPEDEETDDEDGDDDSEEGDEDGDEEGDDADKPADPAPTT